MSVRSSKASVNGDQKKQEEDARARREELKSLLLSKFETKYRGKGIPLTVITSEIEKFLDTMTLTKENLKVLDGRILSAVKSKPGSSHSSVKSESKKAPPAKKTPVAKPTPQRSEVDDMDDRLSVMSGATDLVDSKPIEQRKFLDTKRRNMKFEEGETDQPKTEEDEWAAIIKFNTTLYQEELRQEQHKKMQQKSLLKRELDRQIQEKEYIKSQNKAESDAYIEYQKKHMEFLGAKEKEKQEEKKRQIEFEKKTRELQKKEDKLRKRLEVREEKKKDKELVQRMKKELELEKKAEKEKKDLERRTVSKMMEESLKQKEEQREYEKMQRSEDIKMQEDQQRLLDMQEADRVSDLMKRDERNRKLLENSLKQISGKNTKDNEDEHKTNQQITMLQKKQDDEEEKKRKYRKAKELEVKAALDKQVEEKKARKKYDKEQSNEQAQMWKKELDLHHEQEQKNQLKMKEAYRKHQTYLMEQIDIARRNKTNTMSNREYLLNKKLLDEVNQKLADMKSEAGNP